MRLHGVFAFALVITPVASRAQERTFTPEERATGEREASAAAEFFAHTMRDSSSAIFRNVFIGKRPNPTPTSKIIVCGEVNARNGYGGYTGFQAFMVAGNSVYTGSLMGIPVSEACITDRVFDTRDYSPEMRAALEAASR